MAAGIWLPDYDESALENEMCLVSMAANDTAMCIHMRE